MIMPWDTLAIIAGTRPTVLAYIRSVARNGKEGMMRTNAPCAVPARFQKRAPGVVRVRIKFRILAIRGVRHDRVLDVLFRHTQ